jgi:2-oxoisovalerate dehydrogenase E1 component
MPHSAPKFATPTFPPVPQVFAERTLRDLASLPANHPDVLRRLYAWMRLARTSDDRILEVYRQGRIRGTVAGGQGNEALAIPVALLLDRAIDVISFTHRDLGGHLIWSGHLVEHLCQYLANAGSPTKAREGNVHHGDPHNRSLPMISHLGAMLSNVLGMTDAQRRAGINAVGVAQIGDGGTSTGDTHEAMNWASVLNLPVVFIIQNNHYAYSTPVSEQFATAELWRRAEGYGFGGEVLDATDPIASVEAFRRIIETVRRTGRPHLVEARTLRLRGHAAYDTCEYLPAGLAGKWAAEDPLIRITDLMDKAGLAAERAAIDAVAAEFFEASMAAAIAHPPPDPDSLIGDVYAPSGPALSWKPVKQEDPPKVLNFAQALNAALRRILAEQPNSLVMGQDIADYGGPFKVTDGLLSEFGRAKVLNTPLAESCMVGYATGLALGGALPIVEFQFADFSTDSFTQITLNAATYHFRSGASVPLVLRFPCGGGLTFGSFHSEELEGVFLSMPGLKALYPSTPQDAYNALLAAVTERNPVLLFEHKKLYRGVKGPVRFDDDFLSVWRPRLVRSGNRATIVTYGEMTHATETALQYLESEYGFACDLFDLRALAPLRLEEIRASVARTHRIAVVHEGRRTLGLGAEVLTRITETQFFDLEAPPLRIASADMPVPFAPELEQAYRPSVESIIETLLSWLE